GGAASGTRNNCTPSGKSANVGGGADACMLNNCTLSDNSASDSGGGAAGGTLNNCIVYYNVARVSGANYYRGYFNYSCTTPLPGDGVGNFENPPLFVDPASGNWRLQPNSPCINAGLNSSAAGGTDLDGN